jgi:SPP1 family predicted phage head-tail adaptor
MVMEIGKLRQRVTIQEYAATRDSFGAEVPAWADVATVWASVTPVSGKEYFASAQVNAEVSTKITMRYLAGITPKIRVVFEARTFEIISVLNFEERDIELNLMCKERVEDG